MPAIDHPTHSAGATTDHYSMSVDMASVKQGQAGANSGVRLISRYTKGGRRLWYQLTVLQQPERARACGSGSKSANDRRPVDPPPVVELRIFEGPSVEDKKDITFIHNASFFLFVTLEHARVIAHGRVQQPHTDNQPPVLTGSPVSGMAYLDRPSEAGYFLFPDLSVRHEGTYRLAFQLYEQPKEEQDYDMDEKEKIEADGGPFWHRLDIKSNEFSVYSAKKFPGLAESTSLSRMVAEQGCRVRIRRDVRMRRRDGKPSGDFEKQEDEYARNRRTSQTPEVPREAYYRGRSGSATSDHRGQYPVDGQRRPSGPEAYPPPPYVATQPAAQGNLRFGDDGGPQFSPHYPPSQNSQPPISPTAPYPSEHAAYPPAPPQQAAYPSRPVSQQYPPTTPIEADVSERRISGAFTPISPTHAQPPSDSVVPSMQPGPYVPSPSPSRHLPPFPTPSAAPPAERQLPSIQHLLDTYNKRPALEASIPAPPTSEVRAGAKRSFTDVFIPNTRSVRDGERPVDSHHNETSHAIRQDPDGELKYYRANGELVAKQQSPFIS